MATPNSSQTSDHDQKARKRNVKPIVPVLPLLPASKKHASSESAAETEAGSHQDAAQAPSKQFDLSAVADPNESPITTAQSATLVEEQNEVVAHEEEIEQQGKESDHLNPENDSVGDRSVPTATNEETVTVLPESQEKQLASPFQTQAEKAGEVDDIASKMTANPSISKRTIPPAPLIVGSTVVSQARYGASGSSDIHDRQEHGHINFQAPPESRDPSPVHVNGMSYLQEADPAYVPSTQFSQMAPQAFPVHSLPWNTHKIPPSEHYVPPPRPHIPMASNFSPDAPVFTPANETPPYSLSSTPGMGSTSVKAIREYAPPNGGSRAYSPATGSNRLNGFHANETMHPRPPYRHSQQMTRALYGYGHGHRRSFSQQADKLPQSPPATTGNDGLKMPLVEHLTALYDTGFWADWRIVVQNPQNAFKPVGLAVHGAVIARSSMLEYYMRMAYQNKESRNHISIEWADSFIHPSSFNSAVRYLYNDSLLTKTDVERLTFPGDFEQPWREYQLHCALSYFLSGYMLGLVPVINQGRILVEAIIDWDIVEVALHWAIDYRPKTQADAGAPMTRTISNMSSHSATTSSSSRANNAAFPETTPLTTLPNGSPLVISSTASDLLMEAVVKFLAVNVPFESFVPCSDIRPTQLRPRLPITKEIIGNQRPGPNSQLQSIHFGDFSANGDNTETVRPYEDAYVNHIASIALTNLPFDTLNGLLSLLQERRDPRAYEFAKQIVADRENLRLQVLRSKSVPLHEREANLKDWDVAGYQELIIESGESTPARDQADEHMYQQSVPSFNLERTWAGLGNPSLKGPYNKNRKIRRDPIPSRQPQFEHQVPVQFQNISFFPPQPDREPTANA